MKCHTVMKNRCILLVLTTFAACIAYSGEGTDVKTGTNNAKKGHAAVKRDPFWPVGYMPISTQNSSEESSVASTGGSWQKAMKNVVINGVSSSAESEYYAVINGELKSVGDTVSVRLDGSVYTWAVDSIEPPGSVKLRRVSVR